MAVADDEQGIGSAGRPRFAMPMWWFGEFVGDPIERHPIRQQVGQHCRVGAGDGGELLVRFSGDVEPADDPVFEGAHPVAEWDLASVDFPQHPHLDRLQPCLGDRDLFEE